MRHPLARALRPGNIVLDGLQHTALRYLDRSAATTIPFWRMASTPVAELERRAHAVRAAAGHGSVELMDALPGAGSAPGAVIPSAGISLDGDHLASLRGRSLPVIGRVRDGRTYLDLRSVDPSDDDELAAAIVATA